MFLKYFGLNEQPFGVTPDPRFLYVGEQHREALASLVYGTESSRGFVALIAPPGMGKTSLLYQYLEGLRGKARTAFLFQTDCDSRELLRHILSDLGLDAAGKDLPTLHEMLNRVLEEEMKRGRRFVLVLDEAQNLDEKSLETIRLLSNFETPWAKLMHIVIAGQPQLAAHLARPSMTQLRQRISMLIQLRPFSAEETNAYIDHRLWVAGYDGPPLFTAGARSLIAKHSEGIPRNINNLGFGALSLAYALNAKQVHSKLVREAISDLEIGRVAPSRGDFGVQPISGRAAAARKRETRFRLRPASAFGAAAFLFLSVALAVPWPTQRLNAPGRFSEISSRLEKVKSLILKDLDKILITGEPIKKMEGADNAPATRKGATAEAAGADRSASPLAKEEGAGRLAAGDRELGMGVVLPAKEIRKGAKAAGGVLTVTVPSGTTLRQLSLQYIGRFDVSTLLEICALNPGINDPSQIQAGQRLRLPRYPGASRADLKEVAAKASETRTSEEQK